MGCGSIIIVELFKCIRLTTCFWQQSHACIYLGNDSLVYELSLHNGCAADGDFPLCGKQFCSENQRDFSVSSLHRNTVLMHALVSVLTVLKSACCIHLWQFKILNRMTVYQVYTTKLTLWWCVHIILLHLVVSHNWSIKATTTPSWIHGSPSILELTLQP